MILRENGDIESESSHEETSTSGSECEYSSEEVLYEGDLFMMVNPKRKNIFYSRCLTQRKCYYLIINGGNNVNVASQRLVDKLCIPTVPHSKSYKLQWLSEHGEMIVDKHASIVITLDKYKDEILCDVVPMEAIHVLLGRPWQYDRKVIHDCVTNKFSFMHGSNKVILKHLTPKEVLEDLMMNSPLDNLHATFEKMLEEFKDIFSKGMPQGLPPIRGIEH
ncbi:hypothetical protein CR513_00564, partial [Mucuna pruriens]